MNTEDQQDRIDAYLRGESTDAAAFEREMQQDPQLREDMEATRLALDAITVGGDQNLKERLRKLEADMAPRSAKIVQLKPRKKRSWPSLVAAAAVVLLIAAYFIFRPADATGYQLAAEIFVPEDNIAYTITKSGAADTDPRAAAYTAYEAGNYTAARQAFRPLAVGNPIDEFYLGQTFLAENDYADALPLYTKLAALPDFNLAEESAYYRAIALVGLDRAEEARLILENIVVDANHEKYTEAQNLLGRL